MLGDQVKPPRLAGDDDASQPSQLPFQAVQQRAVAEMRYDAGDVVGDRHEVSPHVLAQGPQQSGCQFLTHTGNRPAEGFRGQLVDGDQGTCTVTPSAWAPGWKA